MKRKLILEDGSIFIGEGFGYEGESMGEVVFTTGMSGYQESILSQFLRPSFGRLSPCKSG